jgi:hypothetical protein
MLEYTPDEHFHGQDSFDYTIEDGNSATASATVIDYGDSGERRTRRVYAYRAERMLPHRSRP